MPVRLLPVSDCLLQLTGKYYCMSRMHAHDEANLLPVAELAALHVCIEPFTCKHAHALM